MRSFAEAVEFLSKGRNKQQRTIDNNTRVIRRDENTVVLRLHSTDIVTYRSNGDVILNSGGWRTVTTKQRMNAYSPLSISQDKGIWYVSRDNFRQSHVYAEGVTYNVNSNQLTGTSETPKDETKLRNAVKRYATKYIKALAAGEIPAPSAGDCWGCSMQTAQGERPMGGRSHMLSHIEENYFVPSLIVRALDMGSAPVQQWGLAAIWSPSTEDREKAAGMIRFVTDDRTRRQLRRFIYRELGLAA